MTKLVWGSFGTRLYEAGTDRGVLFVSDNEGVPWNGLISVKESPTGGDASPFYLDGIKYLNLAVAEEFEGNISAFTSPSEFDVCDGTVSIHTGLFATQQPRVPFGLTYRTKLGNDIDGLDYGYKIHLVYNALAAPSSRENQTLGENVDPLTFSWNITAIPVLAPTFRPTSHFVIDSRSTPDYVLATIEDALYGTDSDLSYLPSIEELIGIFSMDPPVPDDLFTEFFEERF